MNPFVSYTRVYIIIALGLVLTGYAFYSVLHTDLLWAYESEEEHAEFSPAVPIKGIDLYDTVNACLDINIEIRNGAEYSQKLVEFCARVMLNFQEEHRKHSKARIQKLQELYEHQFGASQE